MTLEAGNRLGSYEIVSPLGAGGIAEAHVVSSTPRFRYAVTSDGERFLGITVEQAEPLLTTVVLNWRVALEPTGP